MAERGREKGRRTAAETEREASLARSGTDGGTRKRGPETARSRTVRLARGHRSECRERSEKSANVEKRSKVTFGRSADRRDDDDDDEREREREKEREVERRISTLA